MGKRLGGRSKGTPNKRTLELKELAEKLGVDPFEILLLFAKGDYAALGYDEFEEKMGAAGIPVSIRTIEPELREKAAKDACEYLYPKRKAIEVTKLPHDPLDELRSMTPEQREAIRQDLEKRLGIGTKEKKK